MKEVSMNISFDGRDIANSINMNDDLKYQAFTELGGVQNLKYSLLCKIEAFYPKSLEDINSKYLNYFTVKESMRCSEEDTSEFNRHTLFNRSAHMTLDNGQKIIVQLNIENLVDLTYNKRFKIKSEYDSDIHGDELILEANIILFSNEPISSDIDYIKELIGIHNSVDYENILYKEYYKLVYDSSTKDFSIKTHDVSVLLNSSTVSQYNYNVDALEFKHKIKQFLKFSIEDLDEFNKIQPYTGAFILYGTAGTGKTRLIESLAADPDILRPFLFINPDELINIHSSELINILQQGRLRNAVLVIEDAEKVITSRDSYESTNKTSALLNLTDGEDAKVTGCNIIFTFNTKIDKIDSALLRSGRTLAGLEIKHLETHRAKALLKELGSNPDLISEPTTLSDVYQIHKQNSDPSNEKYVPELDFAGFTIKTQ